MRRKKSDEGSITPDFLFSFMIEKVIMVENLEISLFIYLFAAWGDAKNLNRNLTMEELFMEKMFVKLFSSSCGIRNKENILGYIYSYMSLSNVSFEFY